MNFNPNDTQNTQQSDCTKAHRIPLIPIISIAVTLLLALITFLFFFFFGGSHNSTPTQATQTGDEQIMTQQIKQPISTSEEMRGVWIATVNNINFPSKPGISTTQMKAELDDIVKTCHAAGMNAIFFQALPNSDALYASEVYPWSAFLTGTQGKAPDGGFDPLEYIVEKAHEYGLELHAWMNPYRVTSSPSEKLENLCETHPAKLHPDYIVYYADGKYYYNPALAEVRAMISNEAAYIAKNYAVDGIHMDDYFYPYPKTGATFDDAQQYALCTDGTSLADWRRGNVNATVKGVYDAVKAVNPDCRYGISPFGIYANKGSKTPIPGSETNGLESYSAIYCDPIAWVDGGYIDYLAPQIYWAFSTSVAPFDTIARWWNTALDGKKVDLYIGHAVSRVADFPKNEVPIQVEFARSLLCYKGSLFFGYAAFKANSEGIYDKLTELYSLPLPTPHGSVPTAINYPINNFKTTSGNQFILGSSSTAEGSLPVTVNGERVSRTKDGFFGYFATLKSGNNSLEIVQGDNSLSHSIYSGTSTATATVLPSFDITSCSPENEVWISGGDTVSFSCVAPAGSTVTVTVGGASTKLSPVSGAKEKSGSYIKETYKGSIKFSNLAKDGEIIALGTVTFKATLGSQSKTKLCGLMKQIGKGALIYAQVNKDYTYVKKSPGSSFYDDYTPSSPGMRDYIIGYTDGYYKLRFGGYVSENNVNVVEGQPLFSNTILSAQSEVVKSSEQSYKGNYTELRFGVLENVPVDVWVNESNVTIVLYDTLPETMPPMTLVDNPLFSSVSVKPGASGKTVLYTAVLKNPEHYFGFNLEYDKSYIRIKFNNPIGLSGDAEKPLLGKRIYVDAGHGGTDTGSVGPGGPTIKMYESTLNLLIANGLSELLRSLGATVYVTRTEDVEFDLYERLDMISAVVPDMLISIHQNSVGDSTNAQRARGFVSLYSNNSGILLSKTVSDTVCDRLNRFQRTTAYQKLAMARDHRFPSTLCEMCFICNVEEFQWSVSQGNLQRSYEALAEGIVEFFRKQESIG